MPFRKTSLFKNIVVATLLTLGVMEPSCFAVDKTESNGDAIQIMLPLVGLILSGTKDDREGLKQLSYSVLTSTGITHFFKRTVPKRRPDGTNTQSFVSGHTSLAFAGATFNQIRHGYLWGIPSFVLASYVGHSRIESKRHDTNDVLRGALVGTLSSWLFTSSLEDENISLSFKVDPTEQNALYTLMLKYSF